MPSIAQAVVTVRPDLTGFAAQLRTDLKKQLDLIGIQSRTILINAALAPGSKAALQAQLNKITGLTVEVTPTVSPAGIASLRRQLGIIPIEVSLATGQARKIQGEVAAASATGTATAAAVAGGGTTSRSTVEILAQEARVAGAVENQTKARLALNDALTAEEANLDRVLLAEQRLETTTRALTAETEKLTLVRQSDSEKALTAERNAAIASAEKELAIERERIAGFEAGLAARVQLAAADTALATASKAARDAAIGSKDAIASESAAIQAQAAVKEQLAAIDAQIVSATKAEDQATVDSLRVTREKTAALQGQIAARLTLNEVNLRQAAAPAQIESLTTSTAALELQKKLLADVTLLEEARQVALNAGASALANNIAGTVGLSEAMAAEAGAAAKDIAAQEARATTLSKIAALNAAVSRAINPALDVAAQRTRLIAIEVQLTAAIEAATVATSGASVEDIKSLAAIEARVVGLRAEREAVIANAAAAEKAALTLSQAQRGAAATGAGFLGLRGAVLSASSGFLAATIAVTAFAKIVGTAASLQQSLNVFASVAEASAEQMKAVSETARSLGADLSLPSTSANDAAEAMTELARAGLSVQDSMDAARGVLQLAAAAQIEVKEASTIAATELNAFGLAGTEATRVADLLAGAAKSAQGEITDFALAFQQVAAVAHQVELPIETTTAILTQFAKAGLRGSDAGTSLRTMLLRLVPTTKAATEEQAKLGIEIDRSLPIGKQFVDLVEQYTRALAKLSPVAQQESLTKIFGQDAIRGATISLTNGSEALQQIQSDISQAGIAAEQAAARQKGLTGAIDGLKSELETFAGSVGSILLPSLEAITRDLATVVKTADEAIGLLKELGNISIGGTTAGGIAKQLAGPLGTVALALGVGAGARGLRNFRRERAEARTAATEEIVLTGQVASANVVASRESATAWNRSQAEIVRGSKIQSNAQVVAAQEAAAANVAAAGRSAAGWKLTGAAVVAAAKQSLAAKAIGVAAALTIAGSLASQSGNEDPAAVGNVASAAGTGALLGTPFGPVGIAVGTTAFTGIALLQEARKREKKRQDELTAEWQSMTPAEQHAFIAERFPNQAAGVFESEIEEMLARTGIKDSVRVGTDVTAAGLQRTQTAKEFIDSVGGLNKEDQAALDAAKKLSAERAQFAEEFAKALFNPVDVITGKTAFPGGDVPETEAAIAQADAVAQAEAEIQVAIASASGNIEGETNALTELGTINEAKIAEIQRQLAQPDPNKAFAFLINGEARLELLEALAKALQDQDKINNSVDALNQKRVNALQLTPVSITVAGIQAGATPGLQDNVAAAKAAEAEANKDLRRAREQGLPKKDIDSFVIAAANATAARVNAEQNVATKAASDADKAKTAAKKAADDYISMLEFTAEQAGRIGPAEDKLLAALKAVVDNAKKNSPEWVEAQKAYLAEVDKHQAALKSMADAALSLRDAQSDFALTIAKTTEGKEDDRAVLRGKIQDNRDDIAAIKKRIHDQHLVGAELAAAKEEIVREQADIFGLIQEIKGIDGAGGGFNAADFFAAITASFASFGSNIAGNAGGILSPQQAIGTAAAEALRRNGPQGGPSSPNRGGGNVVTPVQGLTAKPAQPTKDPLTRAIEDMDTEQAKRDATIIKELVLQTGLLARIAGVRNPHAQDLTTGIRGARVGAAAGVATGLGLANRDQ